MGLDHLKIETYKNNLNASCSSNCNPLLNPYGQCNGACFQICPRVCKILCVDENIFPPHVKNPLPQPNSPPLVLPRAADETGNISQKNIIAASMIIMVALVGASVLVCILCSFWRLHYHRQRRERRERIPPIIFGTQEDFLDEDQRPVMDHHVWYINTIGLQQSVIDSIVVFKYKKDEVLIEGTECSVCLNEFQEDDSLRLLPKCSHAFHIPCIDTWLRSHKNCPLCRAPIVSDNFEVQVGSSEPTSSGLSSRSENSSNDNTNNSGITSHEVGEDGSSGVRNGEDENCPLAIEDETIDGNSKMNVSLRDRCRVQSDLVENRQTKGEAEMQPMRRSVSLDSSSAIAIHNAVADLFAAKHQENFLFKYSKSKNAWRQASSGSLSIGRLMKSSSIGHVLQKGPISMKRSFSSNLKSSCSSSSRHSRRQDPILPL